MSILPQKKKKKKTNVYSMPKWFDISLKISAFSKFEDALSIISFVFIQNAIRHPMNLDNIYPEFNFYSNWD